MAKQSYSMVAVDDHAKRLIEAIAERHGMTQISVMSRLIQFFVAQDDHFKSIMVGRFPQEFEVDIARLILDRMK